MSNLTKKTKDLRQLLILSLMKLMPCSVILGHGSRKFPFVALTFDDGPDEKFTPRILEILKEYKTRATFFVIGEKAEIHKNIIRKILVEGHELGSHGYSHGYILKKSFLGIKAEFEKNIKVLQDVVGTQTLRLFRPPRGDLSFDVFFWARYLRQTIVLWSKGKDELSSDKINNGDIILLHGHEEDIIGKLPKIICQIREAGKDLVTITQLMHAAGGRPKIIRISFIRGIIKNIIYLFTPRAVKEIILLAKYRAIIAKTEKVKKDFPSRINLSLSAACQAHCIFCPTARGTKITPKFMSFELAKKIIDDASQERFKEMFKFSENGEALLNKEFNNIFSYFRDVLPGNLAILITNTELLDEEKARFLLERNLNGIVVNIDGATKETYEFVKKGLDFYKVRKNVLNFIRLRRELNKQASICIQILTARNYYKSAKKSYKNLVDDTKDVIKFWYPLLGKNDSIRIVGNPWLWAEKSNQKFNHRPIICQLYERVCGECYIAANGDVYICCLDYNADTVFGNVATQSIREIWNGQKRARIMKYLRESSFEKIGLPCINCM